jgi:hypothetical protein
MLTEKKREATQLSSRVEKVGSNRQCFPPSSLLRSVTLRIVNQEHRHPNDDDGTVVIIKWLTNQFVNH